MASVRRQPAANFPICSNQRSNDIKLVFLSGCGLCSDLLRVKNDDTSLFYGHDLLPHCSLQTKQSPTNKKRDNERILFVSQVFGYY